MKVSAWSRPLDLTIFSEKKVDKEVIPPKNEFSYFEKLIPLKTTSVKPNPPLINTPPATKKVIVERRQVGYGKHAKDLKYHPKPQLLKDVETMTESRKNAHLSSLRTICFQRLQDGLKGLPGGELAQNAFVYFLRLLCIEKAYFPSMKTKILNNFLSLLKKDVGYLLSYIENEDITPIIFQKKVETIAEGHENLRLVKYYQKLQNMFDHDYDQFTIVEAIQNDILAEEKVLAEMKERNWEDILKKLESHPGKNIERCEGFENFREKFERALHDIVFLEGTDLYDQTEQEFDYFRYKRWLEEVNNKQE